MSRTVVRGDGRGRRHLAAVALLAIGVTACGSTHPAGAPATKTTTALGSQPTVRVLSQRQLEGAVVDAHDLPGAEVATLGEGTDGVGNGVIRAQSPAGTTPSRCAPLSAVWGGASAYQPVGSVQREAETKSHHVAILSLVSYRPADALRVVKDLRTALKSCSRYVVRGMHGMKGTFEGITATHAPALGDDAVAFRLSILMENREDGLKAPTSTLVIRHGSTLAVYTTTSSYPHSRRRSRVTSSAPSRRCSTPPSAPLGSRAPSAPGASQHSGP